VMAAPLAAASQANSQAACLNAVCLQLSAQGSLAGKERSEVTKT
jgi:hypothetical protein